MVYCITEMGVYEADTLEHLKKKVDLDLKKGREYLRNRLII